jgi:uncharacterized membrane protein
LLLCTVLVCFLLTQTGFVNRITGNSPLARSLDLDRLKASSDRQVETSFYGAYIPEQDVFNAVWLSKHRGLQSTVYADIGSGDHVLISYGLIPKQLILPLTGTTILKQGSFIYLGKLNVVNGVIPSSSEQFNSSQISFLLNECNMIYSNGNSEIWHAISPG